MLRLALNFESTKQYLLKYKYSSYLDYINVDRREKVILNTSAFPEYFTHINEFEPFINEWLSFISSIQGESLDELSTGEMGGRVRFGTI